MAYSSGLRRSEILNLSWADVDFEGQRIHVQAKSSSRNSVEWEPKDHENRVVPMSAESTQLLADLQAESEEGSAYIFLLPARFKQIKRREAAGQWNGRSQVVNNLGRDFDVIRRRAGGAWPVHSTNAEVCDHQLGATTSDPSRPAACRSLEYRYHQEILPNCSAGRHGFRQSGGKRNPGRGEKRSDAKVTQIGLLACHMKKAAKHKSLAARNLQQWAGRELNPRHADFQSEITFCKSLS